MLNHNFCNIFLTASKASQMLYVFYVYRTVLSHFLPFPKIGCREQSLAELTINRSLPSVPLHMSENIEKIKWLQWSPQKNQKLTMVRVVFGTENSSRLWWWGCDYFIYELVCTAFLILGDMQISFLASCARTRTGTSKLHLKLMKNIWENALLHLHGRQKTLCMSFGVWARKNKHTGKL